MPDKNKKLPKPSDEFMEAVCNAGSISVDCELCGRTHFTTLEASSFEEGELEDLIKKHEKDPDKYIMSDCSSISFGYLDEKQVVFDCPCNIASKYEKLFWNHRHIIRDYLTAKAKKIMENAESESKLAKEVNGAVNTIK